MYPPPPPRLHSPISTLNMCSKHVAQFDYFHFIPRQYFVYMCMPLFCLFLDVLKLRVTLSTNNTVESSSFLWFEKNACKNIFKVLLLWFKDQALSCFM